MLEESQLQYGHIKKDLWNSDSSDLMGCAGITDGTVVAQYTLHYALRVEFKEVKNYKK